MGSFARLRSGWPSDRLRAWRVYATALGMLVVAAAAAVLLAWVFKLAVAAVAIAILGSLPAMILTAQAMVANGGRRDRLLRGRPARQWDPVKLGVHQVVGGGRLPRYVARQPDELLASLLDGKVAASRLVVVRGGSSTGKSRAAYEAVLSRLPDWRLDYPRDAAALAERLEAGVAPRTVLWLRELRDYAGDTDSRALGRLADLLDVQKWIVVITTIWPDDWQAYTTTASSESDGAAGAAGRLLAGLPELSGSQPRHVSAERGGVVDVPEEFTAAELDRAALDGDPVVASAIRSASAAGSPGRLAQYLSGVPALLSQYEGKGTGHNQYGQALIAAAMDAARFGHASPLAPDLLRDAVPGYLTNQQRAADLDSWWPNALRYATQKLNGAIRAVEPVPPAAGTGVVGYKAADYLQQHGRRRRREELGPASLWDALATWAMTADDLSRLGQAARNRGLYRHAAIFWTKASYARSTRAATQLVRLLREMDPRQAGAAALSAASQIRVDDAGSLGTLLAVLRSAGAYDAIKTLLARDPAREVGADNPRAVATLLRALQVAGADEGVAVLASRAAIEVRLDNLADVVTLLRALSATGAGEAVAVLAGRAAVEVRLDQLGPVVTLLRALRAVGADEAFAVLAGRTAVHASLEKPGGTAELMGVLRGARADAASSALMSRDPARLANLDDPKGVARLLQALRRAGADEAIGTLLERDPASQVSLNNAGRVAALLRALREAGAEVAVSTLLARDPAGQANLDNPGGVPQLMRDLRQAGAEEDASRLAAHAVDQVSLDNPGAVATLLRELRDAGADAAVSALLAREPARQADLDRPRGVARLLDELREAGADPAQTDLLARDPAQLAELGNAGDVAVLLEALLRVGADAEVSTLLARDPAGQVNVDNSGGVAALCRALREAGAEAAVATLAARAGDAGIFGVLREFGPQGRQKYKFGREPDGLPSKPWSWQDISRQWTSPTV